MQSLKEKLDRRKTEGRLRRLTTPAALVDFCSNDYLGLSRSDALQREILKYSQSSIAPLGSTGSRLVTGNSEQYENLEEMLAKFHLASSALIFNSGYDANVGLFSAVAERSDTILFDELSHASVRDGVRLSFAKSYSFRHNDLNDLELKLKNAKGNIFIAIESVYSMDGDLSPLNEICILAGKYSANLIVDEAHSTGVFGPQGEGLVCELGLQDKVFARVHTFGKALGTHGAVVLGPKVLREYLINFSRPFIYSTALPPHSLVAIEQAYKYLIQTPRLKKNLFQNLSLFHELASDIDGIKMQPGAIQVLIAPGNENAKSRAIKLMAAGLDVRAILSPTVAKGQERLRICMHAFNSKEEITKLVEVLKQ